MHDLPNNAGTLPRNGERVRKKEVIVNTIQRTAFVERIAINREAFDEIINYDLDNLYPNKIKSIAQRSGTTTSAIKILSSFLSGMGFEGMDTVINFSNETGFDLLRFATREISTFNGFAIQINYNVFGQAVEFNMIPFENVRKTHEDTFLVSDDWENRRNSIVGSNSFTTIEYTPFDVEKVEGEIQQAGGLDQYTGQLFYWTGSIRDIYPACRFDPVLDDSQFEAESKLYKLSDIQHGYSSSGVQKYPANLEDNDQIKDLKEKIEQARGASNAGSIIAIGVTPGSDMEKMKMFEPFDRQNIDSLFTNQNQEARQNIYAAYSQPPILNGVAVQGMFNEQSYRDAFVYYNSETEIERMDVSKALTKIYEVSVFGITEVKIQAKRLIDKQDNGENTNQ